MRQVHRIRSNMRKTCRNCNKNFASETEKINSINESMLKAVTFLKEFKAN